VSPLRPAPTLFFPDRIWIVSGANRGFSGFSTGGPAHIEAGRLWRPEYNMPHGSLGKPCFLFWRSVWSPGTGRIGVFDIDASTRYSTAILKPVRSLSRLGATTESWTGRAGIPTSIRLSSTDVIISDSSSISLFAWPL
jgi:hypothetical protein